MRPGGVSGGMLGGEGGEGEGEDGESYAPLASGAGMIAVSLSLFLLSLPFS